MSPSHSDAKFLPREVEALLARALDDGRLEREPAELLAARLRDPGVLTPLLEAAHASKWAGKGAVVRCAPSPSGYSAAAPEP